jgi:hypothetical protein
MRTQRYTAIIIIIIIRRRRRIRMTVMMKSRVDYIQGMLAIIQSKIFCLPVSYTKKRLKYMEL